MDVKIMQFEPSDLETLRELNREVFQSDFDNGSIDDLNMEWPDSDIGEKYYHKVVNAVDDVIGFVAKIDDQPVGYVALHKRPMHHRHKSYVEIENIGVKPDYRSQGIGKLLVEKASKWAKAQGADRLLVETFAKNNRALKFYKEFGFVESAITLEVDL